MVFRLLCREIFLLDGEVEMKSYGIRLYSRFCSEWIFHSFRDAWVFEEVDSGSHDLTVVVGSEDAASVLLIYRAVYRPGVDLATPTGKRTIMVMSWTARRTQDAERMSCWEKGSILPT